MMPKSSIRRKGCYECPDCLEEFKSKTALLEHFCPLESDIAFGGEIEVKTEEEPSRELVPVVKQEISGAMCTCDICAKPFKTFRGYKIHRSSHFSNSKTKSKKGVKTVLSSNNTPKRNKGTVVENIVRKPFTDPVKSSIQSDSVCSRSEEKSTVSIKREKTYVCSLCPLRFNSIREYRLHFKTHESVQCSTPSVIIAPTLNSAVFHKCPNCPQQFRKVGSYRRHLRSHLNIHAYSCKHCLVSFLTKPELVAHVKQQHCGEKKYSCAVCEKKFYHRMGLMQHKTEHLSDPPYSCPTCDAVFTSISRRVRHLAHHTLKCPLCQKPFTNDAKLWQHVTKVHKDVRDCDIPDETSSEEDDSEPEDSFNELDIESDADSFTSIESSSEIYSNASPRKSDKQKSKSHHVCFICERRFPKQKSLDFHLKSHKIYMCRTCPMFFPLASQLMTHQKEHIEENSRLYSEIFNELQTSVQQQPLQTFPTLLLPSNVPVTDQSKPCNVDINPQPSESKVDSFDLIAWYTIFKEKSKSLKYPIGQDLYQAINQVISELTSALYSKDKLSKGLLERYVKIYRDLTEIISRNGTYLCQ